MQLFSKLSRALYGQMEPENKIKNPSPGIPHDSMFRNDGHLAAAPLISKMERGNFRNGTLNGDIHRRTSGSRSPPPSRKTGTRMSPLLISRRPFQRAGSPDSARRPVLGE